MGQSSVTLGTEDCTRMNSLGLTRTNVKYCCQKCRPFCSYDKTTELAIILLSWFTENAPVYGWPKAYGRRNIAIIMKDLCIKFTNSEYIINDVPQFISSTLHNVYDLDGNFIPNKFIYLLTKFIYSKFPEFK